MMRRHDHAIHQTGARAGGKEDRGPSLENIDSDRLRIADRVGWHRRRYKVLARLTA